APGVVISGNQVRILAERIGSYDNPVGVNANTTYIEILQGDIDVSEMWGLGTTLCIRGPATANDADSWGAVSYNSSSNLIIKSDTIRFSGNGTLGLLGNITFIGDVRSDTPGKEISFEAGKTYTFDGDFTFSDLYLHPSDNAILQFRSFSITPDQELHIVQPDESAGVLVRVTGGDISNIEGQLSANGILILVNPNGITIAGSAVIHASSMILSTLNISDIDFREQNFEFFKEEGSRTGIIRNFTDIKVNDGGYLAILGEKVENLGKLTATGGSVVMASGELIELSFDEGSYLNINVEQGTKVAIEDAVLNKGKIEANGGKVFLCAKAIGDTWTTLINNEGVIEVLEYLEKDGKLTLESNGGIKSMGYLAATLLEESGASFNIGGDYHVGFANVRNADGAVTLNTGNYSGTTQDPGNIIINDNATITLSGQTVFWADDNSDGGPNGSGAFIMNVGSRITGMGMVLTIKASQASTLRYIETTFLKLEANPGYNPVFTLNNDFGTTPSFELVSGTLEMNGYNITTMSGFTVSGGTVNGGSASINLSSMPGATFNMSGGTFNSTSGILFCAGMNFTGGTFNANGGTVQVGSGLDTAIKTNGQHFNNLTISAVTKTVTLQDALNVDGDLTISAGTLATADHAITVGGNWSNSGTFTAGSGTVTFTATDPGNTINSGGSSFYDVFFNGMNGTWDLSSNHMTASNNLTITNGTLDLNTKTLTVSGTFSNEGTLRLHGSEILSFTKDTDSGTVEYEAGVSFTYGYTYKNLKIGGGTFTVASPLDVNGDYTQTAGAVNLNGNAMNLAGSYNLSGGTFSGGSSSIVFDGTSSGNTISNLPSFSVISFTGVGGVWTVNAGSITASTVSISSGATLDCNNYSLTTAAFLNDGTLKLKGEETLTFTNDMNSGTVEYYGAAGANTLVLGNSYYSLKISGGGTWKNGTGSPITVGYGGAGAVLTISTGTTFDLNSQGLTLTSGATFSNSGTLKLRGTEIFNGFTNDTDSGTVEYYGDGAYNSLAAGSNYFNVKFNSASGSGSWRATQAMDVNGELNITSGEFFANGQTINLAGDWNHIGGTFNYGGGASGQLILDGTNQSIYGDNTFYVLQKSVATARTLTFEAGKTQTILSSLALSGASGNLLSLRSTNTDTQWNINYSNTMNLDYLDVKDSNSTGAAFTATNSVSSGNNTNWTGLSVTYTLSGTVYSDLGVTTLAGVNIGLLINGTYQNNDVSTNGVGAYSFNGISWNNGDLVIVFINGNAVNGNTVTKVGAGNVSGLDIWGEMLIVRYETGALITNANLDTALGVYSDNDVLFSLDGSDNLDLNGGLKIWTGKTYAPGANINIEDSFINSGTFTHGNKTVTFDANSGNITTNGSSFYDLTIGAIGASVTAWDAITVANNLLLDEGSLDMGVNDLTVSGNVTVQGGGAPTLDLSDPACDVDINGNVTVSGGEFKAPAAADDTSFMVGGSWSVTSIAVFTHNNGRVVFDSTSSGKTITLSSNNADEFYQVKFNGVNGGWTILADGLTVWSNLVVTNGTLDADTQDLYVGGDLIVNGGTLDLSDPACDVDIGGNVTVTSGTLKAPAVADDTSFLVGGSWEVSGTGTFTHDNGMVVFGGAGSYTIITNSSSADDFYNIEFNGTGTWVLEDDLVVVNDLNISAGYLDVNTGENNKLTIGGDFERNGGDFYPRSGEVVFNGSATSNITGGQAFYNLTCVTPGKILAFDPGWQWYINGTMNINGQDASTRINIRSSVAGNQVDFICATAQMIYYVSVKDCSAFQENIVAVNSEEVSGTDSGGVAPHWVFVNTHDITGTAYSDMGVTVLGGASIGIIINGAYQNGIDVVTTGSGLYTFNDVIWSAGDLVIVFINGGAGVVNGSTVTKVSDADVSGLDIWGETLIVRYETGASITNANLATALGAYSDNDILFSL
ncbi:MAG: filamentous hemagglutinin N-terminal domain-containing protein, partial [Candidatus Omnitrophica bacterium]|nr:filamentous hemagglutinin N-terminal domain-containing protein [Candidatus Omnitrophota bacterium]